MPGISKKAQNMPASPIRKLVPFSDAAKKRGVKVYHLNIGQPDIATPDVAMDAIRNFSQKVVEYSHSAGILSYRQKLVGYYAKNNIHITPDDIIVTSGGSEAILIALSTIMDPDDELIVPEPFYANYNGFSVNCGVKNVPIPSKIDNGFALPAIEEFEKVITPKTKAILVCNPNNPTGYLYSKEEIETLGRLAKKHDLYLLADEVYREFIYGDAKHFSVMELEGLDQNCILVDSVSKRYSACGFRIGAMISKNKQVMAAAMKFAQARLSPPTFGQVASEAAIETPESYFTEVKAEYVARRNIVVDAINKMEGAFCPNPKGAFYVVARLPIDDSDKFCQWLLEDFNLNGDTVMLAPATGFYSTPGMGKDEVRISYVLNVTDMKRSMEILEAALKAYPGKK
ncbi:MAG: pyridoxal phosphate-dependent aminotransferase [Bacteroidales bacterium]|jgi:aspartate aminotransferase|nr:pyridoxal phosphate-dependent aminotransferase [Bacteroidales bacterium]